MIDKKESAEKFHADSFGIKWGLILTLKTNKQNQLRFFFYIVIIEKKTSLLDVNFIAQCAHTIYSGGGLI